MPDPAPSQATPSASAAPGRGGKGKSRGRPNDSPDVQLSKTLSYILRHGAEKEGLKMRKDGFIKLDDLVRRPPLPKRS